MPARANEPGAETVVTDICFPEWAIFVGDHLYFVDYADSNVWRLVGNKTEIVWHQLGCGANGLVEIPTDLIVACFNIRMIVKISLAGKTIFTISQDERGQPFEAPNDLVADKKGGVYFSASGYLGE